MDAGTIRSALEDERDALRRKLDEMTAVPRDPVGAVSFGKRVGEGTAQAVERITQVDAARRLEAKLADVERALVKLDEDTYGRCDACGREIGTERLEAAPWAVLCVDDAGRR